MNVRTWRPTFGQALWIALASAPVTGAACTAIFVSIAWMRSGEDFSREGTFFLVLWLLMAAVAAVWVMSRVDPQPTLAVQVVVPTLVVVLGMALTWGALIGYAVLFTDALADG